MNLIEIRTVEKLLQNGITPPTVCIGANMPGGDKANKKWEEKYHSRVKHLR